MVRGVILRGAPLYELNMYFQGQGTAGKSNIADLGLESLLIRCGSVEIHVGGYPGVYVILRLLI